MSYTSKAKNELHDPINLDGSVAGPHSSITLP